ncbi:TonB-dependent receptor [uncultured Dokdonia sp.]|uniref:TonB-dependent receptor n=1 Tax=uncultured Dokdonia sp. TaxID=575653 RepID=UPI00262167A1|nr:TonB-dependent receptor [uncultured Dokdonia sp.]
MKTLITSFFLLFLSISFAVAQTGSVSGTVNDGQFNDILPFANIIVQGTQKGTTSDFEGKYTLELEPGTYIIEYSFVGYQTQAISEVVIKANETTIVNVTLSSESLDEVIVTTTIRKNTEQSVLNVQRKSAQLLDGLSLENIKKTGASNVAAAVKNVPGVSVQGGKFVYVRGLGDRYTKSILNGVDVPGLDPDRNTLQLDVFPSSILENVIVVKSATADQPADFTGGVVDIVTKDIPSRKERSASIGTSYNPDFHFNENYIKNENSDTGFLGFDDGLRDNPINPNQTFPDSPTQAPNTVEFLTGLFNPQLAAINRSSGNDFNFSYAQGNSYDIGENRLGYVASVSYSNKTTFYEDYIDGQLFRKPPNDVESNELQIDRTQQGIRGRNNVLISALGGLSYKTQKSKYRFNILHVQNGESGAAISTRENRIGNSNESIRNVLTYTERSITNFLLSGKHTNEDASWTTEWKISPTISNVDDKDFRVTPFLIEDDGDLSVSSSETGDPIRFYRELDEINVANKIDITRKHKLFEGDSKLKFGGAYTYKQRDFRTDRFSFRANNPITFSGDPNEVLGENAFNADTGDGFFVRKNTSDLDVFDSNANIAALYVSEEIHPNDWFTAVVGLRFEKFDLNFTGSTLADGITTQLDDEKLIDKADLFPSANLIFNLNEDGSQKIRTSYSRTTARPSFKEASSVFIFNPIQAITELGNLDLEPSYINNFDLRYEIYGEDEKKFQAGDFFAISGFYKTFKDPIEQAFFISDPSQVTWLNLGDANVIGGEIELRKNLAFIGLNNFSFNINFSLIESDEEFSDDERESRENVLRPGETLDSGRQLQGQSPFLLNTGLAFDSGDTGWKAGLFYNVQGKTLQIVGARETPDVFTLPFNDLKFNISKSFGEDKNSTLTLKVSNLLDDDIESIFESFGSEDQIFSRWSPGQSFSLSYSFKF